MFLEMKAKYILIALIGLNLTFAHEEQKNDYGYWNHRIFHFLKQSDWRRAFKSAFNALHETKDGSPNHVRSQVKLGHLYFHFDKSLGDAEGHYRKALQIDPYDFEALIGVADVHFARQEWNGALDAYELARKYHKERFEVYAGIAATFYELGRLESSMHYYEKTLKLNPKDLVSLNNLGNIFFDKMDLMKAREYYLKALKLNPKFVTAHNNIGNVYLHQNVFGEARKHFERALDLSSHDSSVHSNLANLYFEVRQTERAKFHLRKAIYYQDNPVYQNNLAVMEKFTREQLNAGEAYRDTLRFRPDYSNARRHSGFFKRRLQKIQEAMYEKEDPVYFLKFLDQKGRRERRFERIKRRMHDDRFAARNH